MQSWIALALTGLLSSALYLHVAAEDNAKKPVADIRFVLPADQAIISAGGLILNGTSTSVQFFGKGDNIGTVPTDDFASTSSKSRFMANNGTTWLDMPSAVLMGTDGNTTHAVLLTLGNPSYDTLSKTMMFSQATILPVNASSLRVSKGSTAELVAQAEHGIPTPLVTDIANGTVWREAAIFIDHAEGSNLPKASTEGLATALLLVGIAAVGATAVGAAAASNKGGGGTTVVNNYGPPSSSG